MGQVPEKDTQSFSGFPTPYKGIVSPPPLQKPQSHTPPTPCVSPYFCFPFPHHFACPLESLLRLSIFITRITESFSSVNNSEPSLAPSTIKAFHRLLAPFPPHQYSAWDQNNLVGEGGPAGNFFKGDAMGEGERMFTAKGMRADKGKES